MVHLITFEYFIVCKRIPEIQPNSDQKMHNTAPHTDLLRQIRK